MGLRDPFFHLSAGQQQCLIVPCRAIFTAMPPRFIARVARVDGDGRLMPDEPEADLLSGLTYANDDVVLCEVQWIDRAPVGHALTLLLEAACDFLDTWDES